MKITGSVAGSSISPFWTRIAYSTVFQARFSCPRPEVEATIISVPGTFTRALSRASHWRIPARPSQTRPAPLVQSFTSPRSSRETGCSGASTSEPSASIRFTATSSEPAASAIVRIAQETAGTRSACSVVTEIPLPEEAAPKISNNSGARRGE